MCNHPNSASSEPKYNGGFRKIGAGAGRVEVWIIQKGLLFYKMPKKQAFYTDKHE